MNQSTDAELKLLEALIQAAILLENVGEAHWSSRLRKTVEKSPVDLAAIRSWYRGMGSFNDLIIARVNGHHVERVEEKEKNEDLDRLRRQIYQLVAT